MVRYGHLVEQVQERADLPTLLMADRATRSVLAVLGQRLAACPNRKLAARLPSPLAAEMSEETAGEEFGVEELYERVAAREGSAPDIARLHAQVVISVVRETMSVPEFADIVEALPVEYEDLMGSRRGVH
jgi:uncharacterized protein (DUF2267 family)